MWLFFGAAAVVVVALLFVPGSLRVVEYRALPPWPWALGLGVYAGLVWVTRHVTARRWVHASLAAVLFAVHVAVWSQPLGDSVDWRTLATTDVVTLSEVLANLTYRLTARAFGPEALDFVAPVAGALFAFVLLQVVEATLAAGGAARRARTRVFAAAVLALAGWHLVFARGSVENPQLSLPLLVAGLGSLARYARGDHASPLRPGIWLGLATAVHGANAAMLPALAWCVWLRRAGRGGAARDVAIGAAAATAACGAAVAGVWAAGFEVWAGNAFGGANGLFVPFEDQPGFPGSGLLGLGHVVAVGNVLVLACPLVLVVLVAMLVSRRVRRGVAAAVAAQPAYAIAACGGLGATAVIEFDLGFPTDHDLMTGAVSPCNLFLLQVAAVAPRAVARWLAAGLALHGAYVIAVTSALLVAPGDRPRDGERTLTINRRVGEVVARPGEVLFVEVRPPEAAALPLQLELWLHRGEPTPGDALDDRVLRVPLPGTAGEAGTRTTRVVATHGPAMLTIPVPPLHGPWHCPQLPFVAELGVQTVQARFVDAAGRTSQSNAVVLRTQ